MPTFASLRKNYASLWAAMETRPSKASDINATAARIIANKSRYAEVDSATGVPWFVVGVIHAMEAGCNFHCHLHNGDPLTARTRQVPRGRPVAGKPPFTWKDSAIDAVRYDGLDKVKDWSIERISFELEKFNGWGYNLHHPDVNSPYLWSGSNHYARGKYVADGKWSSTAVSGQSGAMPILRRIMDLDSEAVMTIKLAGAIPPPQSNEEKVPDPALAFPRTGEVGAVAGSIGAIGPIMAADPPSDEPRMTITSAAKTVQASRSLWAIINGWVLGAVAVFTDWLQAAFTWVVSLVTDMTKEVDDSGVLDSAQKLQDWLQIDKTLVLKFTVAAVAAISIIVFVRHLRDKHATEARKS